MSRLLNVYLEYDLVGQLQYDVGQMSFAYTKTWLKKTTAIPLSYSLPLQAGRFMQAQCQGFFAGILPEENKRAIIARNLGISRLNDFALLEQIGGECAGAICFLPEGTDLPKRNDHYRHLTPLELAEILSVLPRRPLMAGEADVRLSLAGAQDKLAVHVARDGTISLPLGGAPSTHILKPAMRDIPGIVFNEAFCLKLANAIGLSVAKAEIGHVDNTDYLLVERYDRILEGKNKIHRMHQEDFCQALGIVSQMKYQREGGPSLADCFNLLRKASTNPVLDINGLFDAVIFNFLIGNNDAHGKNFSLLYGSLPERSTRLAPLYDLLCTAYYPDLSSKMAMKIGGEYVSDRVIPRHFEKLAEETGLAKPLIKKRILALTQAVILGLDKIAISHPVVDAVSTWIRNRCKKVQRQFEIASS